MKALANERRLRALGYLRAHKEESVSGIARKLHLSIRSTSKHLGVLRNVRLVEREQRSKVAFYALDEEIPKYARDSINLL